MSRASRDYIGESISKGIASIAEGYIEGQKKKRQRDLFEEYNNPKTSLPRRNQIAMEFAPKEFFKMQQQQESDKFIQELLRGQNQKDQEEQDIIQSSEAPIQDMNQMGGEQQGTPNVDQGFQREVPDVNQLRQEFAQTSPLPTQNMNTAIGNVPQQQQQVDPLVGLRQQLKSKQQQALLASTKNPGVAARLGAEATTIANQINNIESNRAKVDAANIRAKATMDKTAQKQKSEQINTVLPIQQKAMENYKSAETTSFALDNMLASVKNRDVGIWSASNLSNILEEAGYPTLALAAQTQGTALFKTNAKTIFAGAKEIFPKMTNYDAKVFEQMMPSVGRDETANEVSIETLKFPQQAKMEESKFTMELLNKNPNISAIQLNSEVFNHMQNFKDHLYNEWHEKLVQWDLSQKPQRRSIFSPLPTSEGQNLSNKPRKSLEELRREYIPQ